MACNCITRKSNTPSTPSCTKCLGLCDLYVKPAEGPDPCGGVYEVDLKDFQDLTSCTCEDTPTPKYKFHLLAQEDFALVTLTEDGLLSATTSGADVQTPDEYYAISIKVVCTGNVLADTFNVRIGIKNKCVNVVCVEGQSCNPCTGLCENDALDIATD